MFNATTNKNILLYSSLLLTACGGGGSSDSSASNNSGTGTNTGTSSNATSCTTPATALHPAFGYFGPNVQVALSANGCNFVIEATGKPDHVSPYWDSGNASGLYIAPANPTLFNAQRSPGDIDDFPTTTYTLNASVNPQKATIATASALGPVGLAISGAPIFNDQEGGGNLALPTSQGFDSNGAHTGPQVYHYHLEPKILSNDDENLIGIIADGFFLYGRKCYSVIDPALGGHPNDLDASGGHVSITQYTGAAPENAEYHYHVNERFTADSSGVFYFAFPGSYQGTASSIR